MKIVISKNFYNGDYGPGSIFDMTHTIKLTPITSVLNTKLSIITGETFKDKTLVEFNMPISLSEQEKKMLKEIILKIQNEETNKHDNSKSDIRISYTDVKIDKFSCRMVFNNPYLVQLLDILKCTYCESMIDGIKEKIRCYCKFTAQPRDLKFMKTACDGCMFEDKYDKNKCQKYGQKPQRIIENKKAICESYRTGNEPW